MKINAITACLLIGATASSVAVAKEGSLSGIDSLWRQGDVEFQVDGFSRNNSIYDRHNNGEGNWDMNGRIRLGVGHTYTSSQGVEIDMFAQPLLNIRGNAGVDDASLSFAGKDSTYGDWQLKLGRYEAFDMFPLNQDTFIEYSGNTANDLYNNDGGYAYQMKEGRGRTNNGGGILIARQVGPIYMETNTLIKQGTSLFADASDQYGDEHPGYHGRALTDKKNTVVVRPVIAYNNGPFTAAIAGETNVVNNAYGYYDANGKFVDQSKRNGYGVTLQYNTLKENPDDGFAVNVSAAQMHATNERDFSVGGNVLYKNFELGYIYANNRINDYSLGHDYWTGTEAIAKPQRYSAHTVHASYNIKNVAGDPNMNVEVGAYTSFVKGDMTKLDGNDADHDRYGVRVRAKYYF